MKRKIYQKLLHWKQERKGDVVLLIEGARRIGKSFIVEAFARKSTTLISFQFERCQPMEAFHRRAMDYFRQYLIVGGMPQAVAKYVETPDCSSVMLLMNGVMKGSKLG